MALGDDLDKLGLLERRKEILARRLKEAARLLGEWEREVYDRMIAQGWEPNESSFNRNGFRFRPKAVDYAVIQDEARLAEHLGIRLDSAEFTAIKFKKGELNRIVREKLDNGEQLPPGLGSFTKTEVAKSGIMTDRPADDTEEDTDEGS
jgi:hypothetical protein